MKAKQTIYLDFITHIEHSLYKFEGYIGGGSVCNLKQIKVSVAGKEYDISPVSRVQKQEFLNLDQPLQNSTFEVILELPDVPEVISFVSPQGSFAVKLNRFSGLSRLLFSSRKIGNHVFISKQYLFSKPIGMSNVYKNELLTILSILANWRIVDVYTNINVIENKKKELLKAPYLILEAILTIPYAILLRLMYYATKNAAKKPIWLVSDRSMAAGDNGEALFCYLTKNDRSVRSIFFVLSKKSVDYQRMRKIGPVVAHGSLKHKLLLLHASILISSQADTETLNPFARQFNRFVDLIDYKFVFLQHGIIRHDLSAWLNRFNRNISLFVTSSKLEYQSILNNNYYYAKENVLLSGLPRYDLLENQPKKKLILAPTWRNSLVTGKANKQGERKYDSTFKESEYFAFYDTFMNDSRLHEVMQKNGMSGELYLHPVFEKQRTDFHENDRFKVMKYPYSYKNAFRDGSMLVSDHSSVVFDFAYLKKPVLYAYFDVDTFFDGHSYDKSDFFSDEKNGFGDVCNDYESLAKETISLIESGCVMTKKYQQRVEDYFYRTDRNNSERVYNAILEIDRIA